jgi:hypothetical protein
MLGLVLELTDALGEIEIEKLADSLDDGLTDALGDTDALGEILGLTDGLGEVVSDSYKAVTSE